MALAAFAGLLPELPQAFSNDLIVGEGVTEGAVDADDDRQAVTVRFSMADYTPLLHGFKGNKRYSALREKAFGAATVFAERAQQPEVAPFVWVC